VGKVKGVYGRITKCLQEDYKRRLDKGIYNM